MAQPPLGRHVKPETFTEEPERPQLHRQHFLSVVIRVPRGLLPGVGG